MEKFTREQYPTEGKGETDDIDWITSNGAHIPIHEGQTKNEAVQEFSAKPLINKPKSSIVILPKKEYGQFCGTIVSRYANNIPNKGGISLANHYYRFAYDRESERIVCRAKLPIVGNEDKIKAWEEYDV